MRRHNQRRRYRHPGAYYVAATRLIKVSGGFGDNDRWEPAGVLPEGLFAPGATDEQVKLSDATEHRAQLLWHEHVSIYSSDQVEIPALFDDGPVTRWRVIGEPSHWPKGTSVVLGRE